MVDRPSADQDRISRGSPDTRPPGRSAGSGRAPPAGTNRCARAGRAPSGCGGHAPARPAATGPAGTGSPAGPCPPPHESRKTRAAPSRNAHAPTARTPGPTPGQASPAPAAAANAGGPVYQPPPELPGLGPGHLVPRHPGRPDEPEPAQQIQAIRPDRRLRPPRRLQMPEISPSRLNSHAAAIQQPVRLPPIPGSHQSPRQRHHQASRIHGRLPPIDHDRRPYPPTRPHVP